MKSFFNDTFFLQLIIEKMAQNANASVVKGNFSWKEQFREAVTLREGKFKDLISKFSKLG